MSMVRKNGLKVVLPRGTLEQQWELIISHYAENKPHKWKHLAMLALRDNAEWPIECIGAVFNHPKGHVSRCLELARRQLRARFTPQQRLGLGCLLDDEHLSDGDGPDPAPARKRHPRVSVEIPARKNRRPEPFTTSNPQSTRKDQSNS